MTRIKVISCILCILFDDTVPILRPLRNFTTIANGDIVRAVRGVCDIQPE